ncbi:DGQHR domain-containing protein [Paenibacillus sp. FSL P2-0173]|uniref:DGQHR domain-containing protein n=1 Tax=Paenibacillus sp. FSL P2-0173 TaxID=2921627 RepID=UPI0030F60388
MKSLPTQIVIENVLQSKMRGKVAYQGALSSSAALNISYVKPYNDPSNKGYQRPVDTKRCNDFAVYLSKGDDALFTPILLNAAGQWEFHSYDRIRPSFGRLICKGKASLMDGQHRLGGIERYTQETNSEINIPFLTFHSLDEDEEIKLFDTINTKAKGIGPSLSKYLRRDSDELSWIATELLVRRDSPFYNIGSIIGKRTKGRHVTLQNLYRTLHFLIKEPSVVLATKEEKLVLTISYFDSIKAALPSQWIDYQGYRLTHIVCLDALSIAGSKVLNICLSESKKFDIKLISKHTKKLATIDWSTDGSLKYVKGLSGSRTLAEELEEIML